MSSHTSKEIQDTWQNSEGQVQDQEQKMVWLDKWVVEEEKEQGDGKMEEEKLH